MYLLKHETTEVHGAVPIKVVKVVKLKMFVLRMYMTFNSEEIHTPVY